MNRTNQIAPVSRTPSRAPERARGGTSVNQRGARDAVLSSSEQSFDAIDNAALETPSDEQSFGTRENINVDDDDDVDDARSTPETVEETRSNGASFPASDATSATTTKGAESRDDDGEVSLEENTDPRAHDTNPTKKRAGETVTGGLSKNVDFILVKTGQVKAISKRKAKTTAVSQKKPSNEVALVKMPRASRAPTTANDKRMTAHTWKSCPFAIAAGSEPAPAGSQQCGNCKALDLLYLDPSWNR